MDNEKWEELDLIASSTIHMSLAKNILVNVLATSSSKELWEKLKGLYQGKGISNCLLLKERFNSLRVDEHTKVSDHLSVLNGIFYELETIGVEINDEDKALRLIWSLPSSYEHIKHVLIYDKETLSFEEVASKIISEERRLKDEDNTTSNSMLFARGMSYVKKNNETGVRCWKCGKHGHIKYKCHDGEALEKGTELNASNVSLAVRDDGFL
ncbi:unnamed protein product [Lathyrus oleraceus]